MAQTQAIVDMTVPNNATWTDAFQFGTAGDTSWSFSGKTFRMDIKKRKTDVTALLSLTNAAGTIVVDDVVNRILHFNVPDATITADLPLDDCGKGERFVYDLIMLDMSTPPVRTTLMSGTIHVTQGVTGN